MRQTTRVATFPILDRRQEFVGALESILPVTARYAENLALYLIVAAFWGLVLFAFMTAL